MDTELLKRAENNDREAQRLVGDYCYHGDSFNRPDFTKAFKWWRLAAEQGDAEAQHNIGRCYEAGTGIQQDFAQGVVWYSMAAAQGNGGALNNLGLCYSTGHGVKKDMVEAARWLLKAAERGEVHAQYNMGQLYSLGSGVAEDKAESEKWYRKAAAQGNTAAQEALEQLPPSAPAGRAAGSLDAMVREVAKDYTARAAQPRLSSPDMFHAKTGRDLLKEVDKTAPDVKTALTLIERGAALDARDAKGRTALVLAAWRGHEDIVRGLLKAKAPHDDKDHLGNTALIFAAWQGHLGIVKMLVEAGAALNERNLKGYTALVCAASNSRLEAARYLIEKGAVIEQGDLAQAGPDAEKLQEFYKTAHHAERLKVKLLKKLDVLCGQQEVKARIGNFLDRVELEITRGKYGLPAQKINLHTVFSGAPGTGKTTVARIIGAMFRDAGLLTQGQLVETSPAEIMSGTAVGEGAKRMTAKVQAAQGGVLFIDEAYNFTNYKSRNSDCAAEAIDVLLRAMEGPPQQLMVIIAGYDDEIKGFLAQNPGLKSRFQTFIPFSNYNAPELTAIYMKMVEDSAYVLSNDCRAVLERIMPLSPDKYSRAFGNARYVRNLFDETLKCLSSRLGAKDDPTREDVTTIRPGDIQAAFDILWTEPQKTKLVSPDGAPIDLPPLELRPKASGADVATGFDALESLVGLESIKTAVRKIADEMQFANTRRGAGLPVAKSSRHFIFAGNPGTGKTTVARILGKILKEVGYLEQGQVIETSALDLVAGYEGHTAPKTATAVASSLGGILFIDEAYALTGSSGSRADFSQEAVSTLLKLMEDYRDKFVVVAAGYPQEMAAFVASNPGLDSRFTDHLTFENYGAAELEQIYLKLAADFKYVLSGPASAALKEIMAEAPGVFGAAFSNGRFVRNLFDATLQNLAGRVSSKASGAAPDRMALLTIIEKDDLVPAFADAKRNLPPAETGMGFKVGT